MFNCLSGQSLYNLNSDDLTKTEVVETKGLKSYVIQSLDYMIKVQMDKP